VSAGAVSETVDFADDASQREARKASLSETIAALLSDEDDESEDEEEAPLTSDAVPDRYIPQPVCVPLYDSGAPKRKKRGWLWLLLLAAAAGGILAAWKCGYLNLP